MALQHLRSSTAHKRPISTVMSAGQIAINTNEASPALFFKDSNGDLVKVGPVHIGTDAPNSSPASVAATALVTGTVYQILTVGTSDFTLVGASANTVGTIFTATGTTTGTGTVSGQQGVEKGEMWLDTTGGTYVLKTYDGTDWRSESGTFVNVSGDTMTGALLLDNAASASAPDLSFDGDADTGVYSPGADQIALATNGTGRLFVNSSGQIGIGTSDQNFPLSIQTDSSAQSISLFGRAADDISEIKFFENDRTTILGELQYRQDHLNFRHRVGYMSFSTGGVSEKMRLTADGNLGVGTSDPYEFSSVQAGLTLAGTSSSFATRAGALTFKSQNGTFLNSIDARDGKLTIYRSTDSGSSTSSDITIDSSGRLGVGTSTPGDTLTVGSGSGYHGIQIFTGSANTGELRFSDTGGGTYQGSVVYNHASNSLSFGTGSGNTALTIDSSQRVGIGTTSPDTLLHAEAATGAVLRLGSSDTTLAATETVGLIEFETADSTNSGVAASIEAIAENASGEIGLAFSTGRAGSAAERVRMDRDGRVGIGTTNPGGYNSSANNLVIANASGSSGLTIRATSAGSSSIHFADAETTGSASYAGYIAYVHSDDRLVFATSSTERMRISANGHTYWGVANPGTSAFGTSIGRLGSLGFFQTARNVNGTAEVGFFHGNAGEVRIFGDGDLQNTNNSYTGISDIKLKENVVYAGSQWDDVKALQVRNYNFKPETGYNTHTQIGLIAQEVELVSPGLVSESPDRDDEGNDLGTVTKSVNYSVLYMKAVKALQEAMERIETLEQRLSDAGIA